MGMNKAVLQNVQLAFRNFSGNEGRYNAEGQRNFLVVLPEDVAKQMQKDGWNVKRFNQREDGVDPDAYLQVAVNYKSGNAPRVYLVTGNTKTLLDESMVGLLDSVIIKNVDVTLNPYEWVVNGQTGVKAYLSSAYIEIEEDDLDRKYSDLEMRS